MTRRSIAPLIRVEHDKLNRLIDSLREETAVVPRMKLKPWIDKVRDEFEHFRAHFIKHMALEEEDGYLEPVLAKRPALAVEVARLKREHEELVRLMKSIHEDVDSLQSEDRLLSRDLCRRIEALLSYIEHHEREEDLLLIDAVTRDLGSKE